MGEVLISQDELLKKIEYLMEGDTRTLSNPVTEDGLKYEGIYEVYKIVKNWGKAV